jgi:hypothetical protein
MEDLTPIGLKYENGRVPIRAGMMVTGATSMACGEIIKRHGDILYVKVRSGQFMLGDRLICTAGAHGIVGEVSVLDRLANET